MLAELGLIIVETGSPNLQEKGQSPMRLQIIDPEQNHTCHCCGACCKRPWRIVVEEEKIEAIEKFDWGAKYPQLAGRPLIKTDHITGKKQHVMHKDDHGACVFLNHETNKCIIHGELGAQAKPHICSQYPLNVSPAPDADRVYVRYDCPSVQAARGPKLTEQQEEIRRLVKPSRGWNREEVPFSPQRNISIEQCNLVADRMADLFNHEHAADLWERFAEAIRLAIAVERTEPGELNEALRRPEFGADVPSPELAGYASLRSSPLTPRMLLGINLWTDLFPPDSLGVRVKVRKRISMLMKLMQVMQMRGTYASRLLEMNIPLGRLDCREIVGPIPDESSDLLRRWIRSRLLLRSFAINDLTMTAGLHELILDFNAVIFMVRSQAIGTNTPPTEKMYSTALSLVEAHVASQRRLYRVLFPGWTLANLESLETAWMGLRLFCPKLPAAVNSA